MPKKWMMLLKAISSYWIHCLSLNSCFRIYFASSKFSTMDHSMNISETVFSIVSFPTSKLQGKEMTEEKYISTARRIQLCKNTSFVNIKYKNSYGIKFLLTRFSQHYWFSMTIHISENWEIKILGFLYTQSEVWKSSTVVVSFIARLW